METLNGAPEGASARSRSPSRSPEAAPQHPSTPPIRVTESEELVITPDMVSHVDSSCLGCLAPSRRLKHTCTKAKHTGKRHASPSVVARHTKRSGTAPALALLAPEAALIEGASLAIDRGSDVSVRTWEMHVPSRAPPHPSPQRRHHRLPDHPRPCRRPLWSKVRQQRLMATCFCILAEEHDASDARDTHMLPMTWWKAWTWRRAPPSTRMCHRRCLVHCPPPRRTSTSSCRPRAPLSAWRSGMACCRRSCTCSPVLEGVSWSHAWRHCAFQWKRATMSLHGHVARAGVAPMPTPVPLRACTAFRARRWRRTRCVA
jgi:hypothetical protein